MVNESYQISGCVDSDETKPVPKTSPCLRVSVSPRPVSPRPVSPCLRISVSPRLLSGRLPSAVCLLLLATFLLSAGVLAQKGKRSGSHPSPSRPRELFTEADHKMVERAIGVVCTERAKDERGSVPIDDMQKRPSLPLQAPEVVGGAARAQRLANSPTAHSRPDRNLRPRW